jgi:hypothetical protein
MSFVIVAIAFLLIPVIVDKQEKKMAEPFFALNDGAHIPFLAYGVGTALYNKSVTREVSLALRKGVVHFDGAQVTFHLQPFCRTAY